MIARVTGVQRNAYFKGTARTSLPKMTMLGSANLSPIISVQGWRGSKLIISGVRTRHPEVEITGLLIL